MDEYALAAIAEAAANRTLDAEQIRKFIDPGTHEKIRQLEKDLKKHADEK